MELAFANFFIAISPLPPPPLLHDVAMPPPLRRAAAGTTILEGFNLAGTTGCPKFLPGKVIQKAGRCGTMLEFWPSHVPLYVREEGKEGKRSFIEVLPHLN